MQRCLYVEMLLFLARRTVDTLQKAVISLGTLLAIVSLSLLRRSLISVELRTYPTMTSFCARPHTRECTSEKVSLLVSVAFSLVHSLA